MHSIAVPAEALRNYAQCVLRKAGIQEKDAYLIADTLVEANLRGVDTHGILRLPLYYLPRIKKGLINTKPNYSIFKKSHSIALMDADDGPGQVAAFHAMQLAMEIAKNSGVGLVAIKNSSHFGMAAYFAMEALKGDMIGIAMTQADSRVAPFGTSKAYLGTNPLAIAIPAEKHFPIVLDMATSITSMGSIILAAMEERKIPEGVAIDEGGNVTTDPRKVAALLPIGGPKGSGLAIVIDVLCGILTGLNFGKHIHRGDDFSKPEKLGHLVGAIQVASFRDPAEFKHEVDQMIFEIKSLPPAPGVNEILLPGEKEFKTRAERLKKGIPIPQELFEKLQGLEGCYIATD
jgi:ureidoglycolate dehydrogenase (NAD+)